MFLEDMKDTFNTYSDAFLNGRKKLIHSVGTVHKVEFVAETNTPYTGIFRGARNCILRLSSATEPKESERTRDAQQAFKNFKPGFGLKCLRNNMSSANIVGMVSLDGQPSWNFFENDMPNFCTGSEDDELSFTGKKLLDKFSTASKHTSMVGLKEFAEYDENGKLTQNPKFPYRFILTPRPEIKSKFTSKWQDNYLNQIVGLPTNIIIYDVYAMAAPKAIPTKIGHLQAIGKGITSEFGDKHLFFRHSLMELDYAVHPEWEAQSILKDPKFKRMFLEEYGFEHP